MAVHPEFTAYVVEQLGRHARGAKARPMFGGVSIAGPQGTFALIDQDVVYLKGDRLTRATFEEAGWPAFRPFGEGGSTMGYFALPAVLLEDHDALAPWVALAVGAAERARKKKRTP